MKLNPGEMAMVCEIKIDIICSLFCKKNIFICYSDLQQNKWKRPIYFTSTQELKQLGLDKSVRLEELSYRLFLLKTAA